MCTQTDDIILEPEETMDFMQADTPIQSDNEADGGLCKAVQVGCATPECCGARDGLPDVVIDINANQSKEMENGAFGSHQGIKLERQISKVDNTNKLKMID